jgi:integrase
LTQEELHEVLDLLDVQYREVATFMAYTGLDMSDVLKLEWSSVDMKAKMIRTERRKTMHNSDTIKIKLPMSLKISHSVYVNISLNSENSPVFE